MLVSLANLEPHLCESGFILCGPVDFAEFKTYIFSAAVLQMHRRRASHIVIKVERLALSGRYHASPHCIPNIRSHFGGNDIKRR